jgi:hypothetical protein
MNADPSKFSHEQQDAANTFCAAIEKREAAQAALREANAEYKKALAAYRLVMPAAPAKAGA